MLPRISLDPRNETQLRDLALRRIEAASQGELTGLTGSSPITALIEGQVFAAAELLFYANLLPESLALEVLRLSGATLDVGTKARGSLTFTLDRALSTSFTLPAGYVVLHNDLQFILSQPLFIPPGALNAIAFCEASAPGALYNLPAYTVNVRNTGYAYLASIVNVTSLSGGTDRQGLDSFLAEAQERLRDRAVLVSRADYANKAQRLLGAGSNAIALPLDSQKRPALGHIHIFCLTSEAEPPSVATRENMRATMQELVMGGSFVWVSGFQQIPLFLHIGVDVDQVSPEVGRKIYDYLANKLSPANTAGALKSSAQSSASVKIRDLEYWCREAGAIDTQLARLNGSSNDLLLPHAYSVPQLMDVTLDISANGFTETYYYGDSGDRE